MKSSRCPTLRGDVFRLVLICSTNRPKTLRTLKSSPNPQKGQAFFDKREKRDSIYQLISFLFQLFLLLKIKNLSKCK